MANNILSVIEKTPDVIIKDILQVATEAGLTKKHAKTIVEQVIKACRKNKN